MVVLAGQLPPPVGGQNVMIAHELTILKATPGIKARFLAFRFSRDVRTQRQVTFRKIVELVAVVLRLCRIRAEGPIACLIFPIGGPHLAPILRDLFLLPFCRVLSRQLVLHIHAGGIAEALPGLPPVLRGAAQMVYGWSDAAVVLTQFSRRDARAIGIDDVTVVPNRIPDRGVDGPRCSPSGYAYRLLYVGHLSVLKGTPALLRVMGRLRDSGLEVELDVMGEPLSPFTWDQVRLLISELELESVVSLRGVVDEPDKWERFQEADLLIFPSVAPYESQPLVLLEAMMCSLPIVATKWRSHSEILGDEPGGVLFDPHPDLEAGLEDAILDAIGQKRAWPDWGQRNRQRFLEYLASPSLAEFVLQRCCTS